MIIDKTEHQEFLIQAIKSIQFGGNLEQITETARIGREVLEALEKAEIREEQEDPRTI